MVRVMLIVTVASVFQWHSGFQHLFYPIRFVSLHCLWCSVRQTYEIITVLTLDTLKHMKCGLFTYFSMLLYSITFSKSRKYFTDIYFIFIIFLWCSKWTDIWGVLYFYFIALILAKLPSGILSEVLKRIFILNSLSLVWLSYFLWYSYEQVVCSVPLCTTLDCGLHRPEVYNLFYKGPGSTHSRLCGLYSVCCRKAAQAVHKHGGIPIEPYSQK
jgi:hypothetical protein